MKYLKIANVTDIIVAHMLIYMIVVKFNQTAYAYTKEAHQHHAAKVK